MKPVYLILTSYFPEPDSWRCAFVYDQVRAIERTGKYRVVVVHTNYNGDYEYQGVKVWGFVSLKRGSVFLPHIIDCINFRSVVCCLRRANVDLSSIRVVHAHLSGNAAYALKLKKAYPHIRALVQFHDPDPYGTLLIGNWLNLFGLKRMFCYLRNRHYVESVDACIAISDNVAKVAIEFPRQKVYNTYAPMQKSMHQLRFMRSAKLNKVIRLHNGVDTDQFSRNGNGVRHDEFTIGCVGNFVDWKDQITLFRALGEIKNKLGRWTVRVIGSGSEKGKCIEEIENLDIQNNVIWEREVDHGLLPSFYRSLDLFVLPSYFEGFGCVFTEAHSCGTPFMTCKGQGMDDMILDEERDVWLCNEHDPSDLAKKIYQFYLNRQEQRLKGKTDINSLIQEFLATVEGLSI